MFINDSDFRQLVEPELLHVYQWADPQSKGVTRMEATAISHIAICTRDMEKSLAFYRDILGMQVLSDAMTDPTC